MASEEFGRVDIAFEAVEVLAGIGILVAWIAG